MIHGKHILSNPFAFSVDVSRKTVKGEFFDRKPLKSGVPAGAGNIDYTSLVL